MHRYRVYKGGWEGEKQVAKLLSSTLSSDYCLMNGVHFGDGGDIDYIVLGPNGIFAVETKNWSGRITCKATTGKEGASASRVAQVSRQRKTPQK